MCSRVCPCNADLAAPWVSLTEVELNVANRTKTPAPANSALTKDANGMYYLITVPSSDTTTKTYSKFTECLAYI